MEKAEDKKVPEPITRFDAIGEEVRSCNTNIYVDYR